MDIKPQSLRRWERRQKAPKRPPKKRRGRPPNVTPEMRLTLRWRYLTKFGQWGPAVLAEWSQRLGLGKYSPTTVGRVIADLRTPKKPKAKPRRYQLKASNVIWSEDGAAYRTWGSKYELLVVQDEYSRLKLAYALGEGAADGDAVAANLENAFTQYGAPLVLKQDLGSNLNSEPVKALCEKHGVLLLNSPARYPAYNGRQERSMRDIRQWERAMRQRRPASTLQQRLDSGMQDLNYDRPRPVLGGRTAAEAYAEGLRPLPDRNTIRQEVDRKEKEIKEQAASRAEETAARRKAAEEVLSRYGLVSYKPDAETNFFRRRATN